MNTINKSYTKTYNELVTQIHQINAASLLQVNHQQQCETQRDRQVCERVKYANATSPT